MIRASVARLSLVRVSECVATIQVSVVFVSVIRVSAAFRVFFRSVSVARASFAYVVFSWYVSAVRVSAVCFRGSHFSGVLCVTVCVRGLCLRRDGFRQSVSVVRSMF